MKERAAARDETRDRIVRATMALHDEQGVATTSFADVAGRAGVGAATVLRHFPTIGALVMACGAHVAAEMRPPSPADAPRLFAGLKTRRSRLERLASELDGFYSRGAFRLFKAANDRERVPELDQFLTMVEAGVEAMIKEALSEEMPSEALVAVFMGLCNVSMWQWLKRARLTEEQRRRMLVDLFVSAIATASLVSPAS